MLSFNNGRAIAKVKGGEMDGSFVFVKSDTPCCDKCSAGCSTRKKKCCKLCNNCCDNSDDFDDLELESGKLIPMVNIETREIPYIAGPSGSGKSTYGSKYVETYKKIFPDKRFYLFSRKDSDPVLDKLKPIRIKIDERMIDNPIDVTKELSGGGLVMFDDVNTILDDKLKKEVDKLISDILEIGRSFDIYTVITNHLVIPNEKKIARTILNEMHSLTVFPKSGSVQQIKYALKTYVGLNNKQIDKIISLPSRWVTIHKTYPICIMYESGCYIP